MTRAYEIRSGRRIVSIQRSTSPLQAAVDYVKGFGTKDDEIIRVGVDVVAWRGARFTAVLAPEEQKPPSKVEPPLSPPLWPLPSS